MRMNQETLDMVIETLQTFIELKQQNYLIQGWIQLKKIGKTNPNIHSRTHISSKPQINHYSSKQFEYLNLKQEDSFHQSGSPSMSPRQNARYKRMPTEHTHQRVGQGLFETFNQNKSAYWTKPPLLENQVGHQRKVSGYVDLHSPELDDSGQFQDIVLDRLSKLQKSVNEMMREKKVKQTLRGYVGAPIQHNRSANDLLEVQQQLPAFVQPPSDRVNQPHIDSPKRRNNKPYQSWNTSPVGKPKQEISLKYIPMHDPSPVNLNRIRKILEEKSQKGSSVNSSRVREEFASHNASFTSGNIKRAPYTQKKIDQAYVNQIKGQFQPPLTNQKSKDLYNKYGFSNTTKNQSTPQQYFSKNIQIQSVYQSRNKYGRTPNSTAANNIIYPKPQIKQTDQKISYPGRISGASSLSGHSYFSTPGWRQERMHY